MNLFSSRYLAADLDAGNYCLGFRCLMHVWFVYLGPLIVRVGRDELAEILETYSDPGPVKLKLDANGKWDIHEGNRNG
ncbi:MAG: hypothetical protein ACYDHF_08045 [Candidatus Cryosericum sp.]